MKMTKKAKKSSFQEIIDKNNKLNSKNKVSQKKVNELEEKVAFKANNTKNLKKEVDSCQISVKD